MRKLLAFLLLAAILGAHLSVCAGGSAVTANSLTIYTPNEDCGDIYTREEPVFFYVQVKNPTANTYDAELGYIIQDADRSTKASGSLGAVAMTARSTTIKSIRIPETLENGIYTMVVTLQGSFGDAVSKSVSFSFSAGNGELSDDMGMCAHYGLQLDDSAIGSKQLAQAGFGWVRDEIRWSYVEQQKGVYQMPAFINENVDNAKKAGNKVLLILCYGNQFYDNKGLPTSAEGLEAYAAYCRFVANYFKGRVDAYEIWNEPDLDVNTGNIATTGQQYAEVLKAGYQAVKSVDSTIPVIGATTSYLTGAAESYFGQILSVSNIGNYMDAIGIHPYDQYGGYADENTTADNFTIARQYMKQYGLENKPLWVTEVGCITFENDIKGWKAYSKEEQAVNLVRMGVMGKKDAQIEKLFYYGHRDTTTSSEETGHFGVVEYDDYKARPAILALAAMNKLLHDASYTQAYGDKNTNYSFTQFQNQSGDVAVIWKNSTKNNAPTLSVVDDKGTGEQATLEGQSSGAVLHKNADASFALYDMYGNPISYTSAITLTDAPIYLVYNDPEETATVTLATEGATVTVTGKNAISGQEVSIAVRNQEEKGKPFHYIGQTQVDTNGDFQLQFTIDTTTAYTVIVYDGTQVQKNGAGTAEYDVTLIYTVDGETVAEAEDLKANDELTVSLEVEKFAESPEKSLMFFGGIYAGVLSEFGYDDIVWNGKTGHAEITIKIPEKNEITDIKSFLWDNALNPITKAIEF